MLEPITSLLDPKTIVAAGYFVITAIIFAECGLLFGFFLPGDSLLFTAGFLASQGFGDLNIVQLSALCGLAAALGPLLGYWYGKMLGPHLFNREDSLLFRRAHLMRAHAFYERHGGKALILARFIPIVRTFAPVVAGMAVMDYSKFILYTIVGAVLWAVGVTWLGYFLGSLIPEAGKYLEYIIVFIILISVAPPLIHYLRDRAKSRSGEGHTSREATLN
jgi:membrane-associated protein